MDVLFTVLSCRLFVAPLKQISSGSWSSSIQDSWEPLLLFLSDARNRCDWWRVVGGGSDQDGRSRRLAASLCSDVTGVALQVKEGRLFLCFHTFPISYRPEGVH